MAETTKNDEATQGEVMRVKCSVYSRIVGYLTPVENWNAGKAEEWGNRKTFDSALRQPPVSIENSVNDPEFTAWEMASDEALENFERDLDAAPDGT